jgi:cytochrome c
MIISKCLRAAIGVACLLLVACGSGESGSGDGATPGVDVPFDELLASADLARGKTLYLQCRACHSLEAGGPNKVGPNLHGMFGRKAGLAPGFPYSIALAQSEIVWTPATMDPWIERPGKYLPGNRMIFGGIKKRQDRANLIAFLMQETTVVSE